MKVLVDDAKPRAVATNVLAVLKELTTRAPPLATTAQLMRTHLDHPADPWAVAGMVL